jgi:DNA-binding response OmpR family regulator
MSSEMMGMRVLVAEDVFLIADMLDEILKERGCEVIGPVAHLDRGLALARDAALDGAILDVNLEGELCFPIAAVLDRRGIPYFFVTGYGAEFFPPEYRDIFRLTKPFASADLEELVARKFSRRHALSPSDAS